ncbi:MAG: GTP-binding protein, partial [Bacteroidales bacterium]|nr:GTP-binding protein [Bacteroidales bacterium]
MDENSNVYTVEEVKNDLKYFAKGKKLYTTIVYHASIDARTVLEDSFESEYENNMYEDWIDFIINDITDEDVEKVQAVIDEILSR